MAKCSSCGRQIGFSFGKKLCRWCVEYQATQRGDTKNSEVQRVMPTPWRQSESVSSSFNYLFIGINLLVFLAMIGAGFPIMGPSPQQMIPWGANFGPLTLGGEPWRLLSYMFLHYGIIHFGFNMWCLWDLGALAESLYGDWVYAIVYILCGLGGGICSVWWHPNGVSAGASGAVFGIAGALIASLKLGEFSLPRPMIAGTFRSVIMFAGYNLVFGAISGRTDNACHIGGLLTGLALGALIAVVAPDRNNILRRLGICAAVLAIMLGCLQLVIRSRGYVVMAQQATMMISEGKISEAIPYLERAIRLRPDYALLHQNLAYAYARTKNYDKAEAELRRAIDLDPRNQFDWYGLGTLYLSNNKPAEANRTFSRMLELNPKSAYAHFGLAAVASAENKHELALQELDKSIALDPRIGAEYNRGLTLTKLKRYDEALASLKKHQEVNGDTYEAEMALADVYRSKGLIKEADEATARANELKQNE